ncbi:unnamed protein product, partial [marine sediment metagenome]
QAELEPETSLIFTMKQELGTPPDVKVPNITTLDNPWFSSFAQGYLYSYGYTVGAMWGGSGQHNWAWEMRSAEVYYDELRDNYGGMKWDYNSNVLPIFKSLETYDGGLAQTECPELRGDSGPIHVISEQSPYLSILNAGDLATVWNDANIAVQTETGNDPDLAAVNDWNCAPTFISKTQRSWEVIDGIR